jgi:hypothetical protein
MILRNILLLEQTEFYFVSEFKDQSNILSFKPEKQNINNFSQYKEKINKSFMTAMRYTFKIEKISR